MKRFKHPFDSASLRSGQVFSLMIPSVPIALCAMFVALAAFPPKASAIILIEVLDPLTLFEIEGITFATYSTSERTTIRVMDTDTGRAGIVDVQGQLEGRANLVLCAFSRDDPSQKVRLEIDVTPLRGPATQSFFQLDARGMAVEPPPVTDFALAALEGPLSFGFMLESEMINPETGNRDTTYELRSIGQVPEPGSLALAAAGALTLLLLCCARRAPIVHSWN